jgi:hypothetical protein
MKNLRIYLPLVDGSVFDLEYDTGMQLIHEMVTDDWGAPPRSMVIEARTDDGKRVVITIPYSASAEASAQVEEAAT